MRARHNSQGNDGPPRVSLTPHRGAGWTEPGPGGLIGFDQPAKGRQSGRSFGHGLRLRVGPWWNRGGDPFDLQRDRCDGCIAQNPQQLDSRRIRCGHSENGDGGPLQSAQQASDTSGVLVVLRQQNGIEAARQSIERLRVQDVGLGCGQWSQSDVRTRAIKSGLPFALLAGAPSGTECEPMVTPATCWPGPGTR